MVISPPLELWGEGVIIFFFQLREKSKTELQKILVLHNGHAGNMGMEMETLPGMKTTKVPSLVAGKVFFLLTSYGIPTCLPPLL